MMKMLLPSLEVASLIIRFLSTNLKIALKTLQIQNFKRHLMAKKRLLTTRKPRELQNLLVRAKFETKTIPREPKLMELFLCKNCVYCNALYIVDCSSFSFKLTNDKTVPLKYKNYFPCDSKDVIHILICKTCYNFYLKQTEEFQQRPGKQKSDVKNSHNSTCRICSEYL